MAEISAGKRMSISFTLPISCQICLGKVKHPVVCPNHHVFCNACIEVWLQHKQQCPTCRVPITPDNPCKQIIGGQSQENEHDCYMSNTALRRARFDILYQDCENEIKRLQQENENLKNCNSQLQEQLAGTKRFLVSGSGQTSDSTGVAPARSPTPKTKAWRESSLPSPKSSPSASKLKGNGKWDRSPGVKRDRHGGTASSDRMDGLELSSREDGSDNDEALSALRSKLKQATLTYEKIKQDTDKLKEKNVKLSTDNRALLAENGRLKQAAATRSPRKYERYTSMAQQSKLDSCRREVSQLKSALERSDAYIEELETGLGDYKSMFGSLPRKRHCHERQGTIGTLTGRTPSMVLRQSETDLTFRSMDDSLEDAFPPASPGECLASARPDDDAGTSTSGAGLEPLDGVGVQKLERYRLAFNKDSSGANSHSGQLSKDARQSSVRNKAASRVPVPPKPGSGSHGEDSSRNDGDLPGSDDNSDLDGPSPMKNTPSTAMGRLTLDSAERSLRPSAPESLELKIPISPSCHRQLDFGRDSPETAALQSSLAKADTRGLLLEGNTVDVGPLDPNATFSDLDFTLTSEISDCAQLMKEAEKRVTQKWLSQQEGEAGRSHAVATSNIKGLEDFKLPALSRNGDLTDDDACYFAPITSALNKDSSDQLVGTARHRGLHLKSQDIKGDLDSGNIRVAWSRNQPSHRLAQRSKSPQEPITYISGAFTEGVGSTSHVTSPSSQSSCKSLVSGAASSSALLPPRFTGHPVLPKSSTLAASDDRPSLVHWVEPPIRPQAMRLGYKTDLSQSEAVKSDLGDSRGLLSDGGHDLGTCDSAGARVGSAAGRPRWRGNALLAAGGSETHRCLFFRGLDDGGGDTEKANRKRIRLEQDSDDVDRCTVRNSPTL